MDLTKVLSIAGKPGLYKVLGQTQNNGIIVESLLDGKRFPAYATHQISSLEDISIYTETDDVPLKDVFKAIYEKEGGKESISHKESPEKLREYFKTVLPDYDEERVYNSDIKKVIRWYNNLQKADMLKEFEEKDEKDEKEKSASGEGAADNKKPKSEKSAGKKETKRPANKGGNRKTKSGQPGSSTKKSTSKKPTGTRSKGKSTSSKSTKK